MSKHTFQTEVNQLLDLMIHSLYSNREIFLRELISNASDAIDKLKFLTVSDDNYKNIAFDPKITISFDETDRKWIKIEDSGIGMNEADLVEHLGTIAKSGTKSFVANLTGDHKKDSNLIGQFGVGFYSSFMVASSVDVITKKAGEEKAYKWSSDGKGEYTITEDSRQSHGSTIILHLNDDAKEFANRWTLESTIKKYSNHIPFPIFLNFTETKHNDEGKESGKEAKTEQIGTATALWKQPKSSIKKEDYQEFYKTISGDSSEPLAISHTQAEGTLEYTTLFFIPSKAPFDLFRMDYQAGVKLYVKRVFITDDEKELLPTYLRFVRGIIDSEDLPLNVSREILQENRVLANIKSASVKKILSEIETLSKDAEKYSKFHKEFGRCIKEGLYQDYANRDQLLELVRFKSSSVDGITSLAGYKERMKSDQKAIYYITGQNESLLRNSPLLEAYKRDGIEVLIMDDEIDEIVISQVHDYKETPLKAINRSDANDEIASKVDEKKVDVLKPVLAKIKNALGDQVKDVVVSKRLSDSVSCIVLDANDPSVQMQQMMKMMGNMELPEIKPILEINPDHEIVAKLANITDDELISDISHILLDQAQLVEGVALKNPSDFGKRLSKIISKAL